MSMAATHPFSIRLDPDLKQRLEQAARRGDRSASYVATEAIRKYLDAQQAKDDAIAQALIEADKGRFISSEAMNAWVDSWGTETEKRPVVDIK